MVTPQKYILKSSIAFWSSPCKQEAKFFRLETAQQLLRHTNLRTTEIYLQRVGSGLREAVNTLPTFEEEKDD
jgi:hypothetical protein